MTDRSPFNELLARIGRTSDTIRMAYGRDSSFRTEVVPVAELDDAIELGNANQSNVWFEINPSDFAEERGRSSAKNITQLATLYIDVDYKGGGMGDEAAARQLIDDLTAALGCPPAAIVRTGNGMQPYWPISDGFITDEASRIEVLRTLARFKALVDGFARQAGGSIDSLFDLPRIFRVPGSLNWKQADDPKPVTAEFPEGWAAFTLAELNEIFDDYNIDATPREVAAEPVSGMEDWEWADHDCEFVTTFRHDVLHGQVTARHPRLLAWVAQLHGLIRYGCVTEETWEVLRRQIDARHQDLCRSQEPVREPQPREFVAALRWGAEQASLWSEQQLISEMRSHTHADFLATFAMPPAPSAPTDPVPSQPSPPSAAAAAPVISLFTKQPLPAAVTHEMTPIQGALALSPQARARLAHAAHTDAGNAELFAQAAAGRFINVSGIGWYQWDGIRWRADEGGLVREAVKDLFTQRLIAEQDLDEQKWLMQSLNAARMTATLKWAESVEQIRVSAIEMDRNPYELVTPGGIFDLKARTLRAPDPLRDRNTKLTAFGPVWDHEPTQFLKVVNWAFHDDPGMVAYIQRLFGMALIGEVRGQMFPIFLGSGANGKSLIFEVVLAVLGSYGMKLSNQFLTLAKGDRHPEELAALRGVRLALASETNANTKFDEQLVKAITGDATLRARRMHENSAEFHNATTLMLAANHLPSVTVGGPAWWRRQRLIEMNRVWPENDRDDTLAGRIAETEGAQVLAWMLDGTAAYLQAGEQTPPIVRQATARYRSEEDTLARYIETRLVVDPTMTSTRQGVYLDYQMWANMNRIFPVLSEPKFVREFLTINPAARIDGNDTHFLGVYIAGTYQPEAPSDGYAAIYGS